MMLSVNDFDFSDGSEMTRLRSGPSNEKSILMKKEGICSDFVSLEMN
jgi:hypothetical protein